MTGSAADLNNIEELKDLTRKNCKNRGDNEGSINETLISVDEELESWKQMVDEFEATEYKNWNFPEYLYMTDRRIELLKEARNCLLEKNSQLEIFFKPENQIK